jgi:GntR family transcriptional regulator
MPAFFTVDPRSGVPIYLQIAEQVKRSVALGLLAPGEQLPTVKQMSAELVVNPNTISRAYRELEHEQIVDTLPGRGSFISGDGTVAGARRAVADVADQAVIGAVREAKSIGLGRDALKALFERALARFYPQTSEEDAAS